MKKILLCLCFVFAVGLLFSACGKDDKSSSPNSTTSAEIDGKDVELCMDIDKEDAGGQEGVDWKVEGNTILVKIPIEVATPEEKVSLKIKNSDGSEDIYELISGGNPDDTTRPLKAVVGEEDKTEELGLEGQKIVRDNSHNPVVAGDNMVHTFKITKLFGKECNLSVYCEYKAVDSL